MIIEQNCSIHCYTFRPLLTGLKKERQNGHLLLLMKHKALRHSFLVSSFKASITNIMLMLFLHNALICFHTSTQSTAQWSDDTTAMQWSKNETSVKKIGSTDFHSEMPYFLILSAHRFFSRLGTDFKTSYLAKGTQHKLMGILLLTGNKVRVTRIRTFETRAKGNNDHKKITSRGMWNFVEHF